MKRERVMLVLPSTEKPYVGICYTCSCSSEVVTMIFLGGEILS